MLIRRDLYKRALVISRLYIKDIDTKEITKNGFERLLACGRSSSELMKLRKLIYDQAMNIMKEKRYRDETKLLRRKFKIHHLLIDIPRSPSVEETHGVMIPVSPETGSEIPLFVPLIDLFPIEKWVDAYNAIKWTGHVFTIKEAVRFVNPAALRIFSLPPYNIIFTMHASDPCKRESTNSIGFGLFNNN